MLLDYQQAKETVMNRREFIRCAGIGGFGHASGLCVRYHHERARASAAASSPKADYYVPADIKNLIKGGLSLPTKSLCFSVDSGAVVDIETVSMLGIAGTFADYVKRYSLSTDDPIIYRILASEGLKRSCSPGNHVLTGPHPHQRRQARRRAGSAHSRHLPDHGFRQRRGSSRRSRRRSV